MAIIINDTGRQFPRLVSLFKETQAPVVKFFDETIMIVNLKKVILKELNLEQKSTFFIYPGESAQRIKSLGFSDRFYSQEVFAKRIWYPGTEPVILVHSLGWGIHPEVENVVVVDDVISTGATVALVRERNYWKFPRAAWYAASPITRKEKIKNFKKIFSCEVVRDMNGKKVPINSLSTLIDNLTIRQSYFARNFEKGFEEKFVEAIG